MSACKLPFAYVEKKYIFWQIIEKCFRSNNARFDDVLRGF